MKVKTADLIGPALDWAVAKCLGATKSQPYEYNGRGFLRVYLDGGIHAPWEPSRYWAQGGPIIDREKLSVGYERYGAPGGVLWDAVKAPSDDTSPWLEYGPTPLIAAMRCYVASHLGDEVDVPDELLK